MLSFATAMVYDKENIKVCGSFNQQFCKCFTYVNKEQIVFSIWYLECSMQHKLFKSKQHKSLYSKGEASEFIAVCYSLG